MFARGRSQCIEIIEIMAARRSRVSERQMKMLLDFMEEHPELLRGKFSSNFTTATKNALWQELTNLLNSDGTGPTKSSDKWVKTWTDWKSITKGKAANVKKDLGGTGGGPPRTFVTENEARLMGLISWATAEGFGTNDVGIPKNTTGDVGFPQGSSTTNPVTIHCEPEILICQKTNAATSLCSDEAINFSESQEIEIDSLPVCILPLDGPQIHDVTPLPSPLSPKYDCASTSKPPLKRRLHGQKIFSFKKKCKASDQASTFQRATECFTKCEDKNVAAREAIAAALARLATAAENQAKETKALVEATNGIGTAINNVAVSLAAIASALHKSS